MGYLPEGGRLYLDFITEAEEDYLLDHIEEEKWSSSISRRVQQYGYEYDYRTRKVKKLKSDLGQDTWWLEDVMNRMSYEFGFSPDQAIINEYRPGQKLAPHVDAQCFGPVVASLSLLDDWLMVFERRMEASRVMLPRRSLVVLTGDARYGWTHAIQPQPERSRRISVTFRTVNEVQDC